MSRCRGTPHLGVRPCGRASRVTTDHACRCLGCTIGADSGHHPSRGSSILRATSSTCPPFSVANQRRAWTGRRSKLHRSSHVLPSGASRRATTGHSTTRHRGSCESARAACAMVRHEPSASFDSARTCSRNGNAQRLVGVLAGVSHVACARPGVQILQSGSRVLKDRRPGLVDVTGAVVMHDGCGAPMLRPARNRRLARRFQQGDGASSVDITEDGCSCWQSKAEAPIPIRRLLGAER